MKRLITLGYAIGLLIGAFVPLADAAKPSLPVSPNPDCISLLRAVQNDVILNNLKTYDTVTAYGGEPFDNVLAFMKQVSNMPDVAKTADMVAFLTSDEAPLGVIFFIKNGCVVTQGTSTRANVRALELFAKGGPAPDPNGTDEKGA